MTHVTCRLTAKNRDHLGNLFCFSCKCRMFFFRFSDQESSCDFIGFDQAVSILRAELNYPEERALHFVKRFDHNKDGKLSVAEFRQFKGKIEET